MILCTNCKREYPDQGLPFRCPVCGGVFDFNQTWKLDLRSFNNSQPGIWRWGSTFGLPKGYPHLSLGEGNTPLVWRKVLGRQVAFKCEFLNPTGSFKDRGTAVIAAWLASRGVGEAVEDSSGNAGASFAAYASRARIKARIFVPESASGPKRQQIKAYGAEMVSISGSRSDVSSAVIQEVEKGAVYASHAWLPFNLPGYATAAYEIYEQLGGSMPGSVIVPMGQGGFYLGLKRGFDVLRIAVDKQVYQTRRSGQIMSSGATPRMVGVQAQACGPLWALYINGISGLGFVQENPTLAEGVKVRHPIKAELILEAVNASNGVICLADEKGILAGREELARMGLYVEPTSAIVWTALEQQLQLLPDPVIVVLTGSGFKYSG